MFNGFGIVRLRIPPFIMTLSTMCIVNGVALKIRPVPGGSIPYEFMDLLFGRIGIFPHAVLLWAVAGALLVWLLGSRRLGRNLYAVGGNPTTAALSGIPVGRVRMQAHILCSVLAAVGGICVAARMGSGDATLGETYSMDSVTCLLYTSRHGTALRPYAVNIRIGRERLLGRLLALVIGPVGIIGGEDIDVLAAVRQLVQRFLQPLVAHLANTRAGRAVQNDDVDVYKRQTVYHNKKSYRKPEAVATGNKFRMGALCRKMLYICKKYEK